jgi:2-keto-4-pentenoate hydratase/2-oxohepta-3-ene-1,7-dioic acid hydratase in catechol pathway
MKIICIGRNYRDHAKELNNPVPKSPLVFMKPSTALLLENKPFYHPEFSDNIHYELEVVLKICKNGRSVQPKFASDYYEEIGLGIDFTARDIQAKCKEKGHPWEKAKGFDHSAVLSPFISKDKFDLESIKFQMHKNGELVQDGDTADLIFKFDYLIEYVSKYFKLQIGDLIYTGTPAGVGQVKIGDKLEGFLEGNKILECQIK